MLALLAGRNELAVKNSYINPLHTQAGHFIEFIASFQTLR
jgi:hypothetical protein